MLNYYSWHNIALGPRAIGMHIHHSACYCHCLPEASGEPKSRPVFNHGSRISKHNLEQILSSSCMLT